MLHTFKKTHSFFGNKLSLKRAIFSYVLVFLIPTFVMTLLVQFNIIDSIYKNEKKTICDQIEYTKLTIDQQIGNFSDIVNYLFLDKTIKNSDMPSDYLSFLNVQTDLQRISAANTLINEFSVYLLGNEYIISTKSSYHIKLFLEMFPINEIKDENEFYNFLNTEKQWLRILHGEVKNNKEKYSLFIFLPNNIAVKPKHALIFTTLESSYHNALKNALGQNTGCSFVTDTDGNIISYYSTDSDDSIGRYLSMLSESGAGSKYGVIKEYNGHLIYSLKSDYIPIIYSIVISEKSFAKQTSYIRFMWYGVIFTAVLLGILAALLLGHKSYKPISSLRLKASTLCCYDQTAVNDDYHYLYEAIEYIGYKNTMLQNNLDDINDYIIFKLLKGALVITEEIEIISKLSGFALSNSLFKVVIIKTEEYINKSEIYTEILKTMPKSANILMRSKENDNTYVIIIVYEKNITDYKYPLILKLETDYKIFEGSIQSDIKYIPLSYMEAAIGSCGSSLYCEMFTQLEDSFNKGEYNCAKSILRQLIHDLKNGCMELADAKLSVIRFVLLLENNSNLRGNHVDLSTLPDTFKVLRYESLEDAILFFERYGEKLITELLCPNTVHGDILNNQMIIYLKNHYRNFNFSLQQMADEFNMTLPVLSRQFYDYTGQTPIDFISDLKMATVKDLLANTNLSINEISMEVGYYNVNSFIRWFKKLTNETPGNFRTRK